MKNLSKLVVLFLTITIYSCQKHDGYVITGNVTGFPDSTMIYLRNLSTDDTFDSAMVIGNKFQLRGQLAEQPERIYLNTTVDKKFIYAYLLIGNEYITLEGVTSDFPYNVKITGSETQATNDRLHNLTKSFSIQRDSLVTNFFALTPEEQEQKGKEIWGEIRKLDSARNTIEIDFIKSNINTYTAIINLDIYKNSLPKDTVQALYDQLNDELKASKFAKAIKIYLDEKIAEVGDTYHDFTALNQQGDTIRFSTLTGKHILLDFTSIGCGPCFYAAKEMKSMHEIYGDSLTIVSFCVDVKKEDWQKMIERDSVNWISLWDGQGRFSETYIKYGVRGYPTFLYIDPEGKIVDKWAGYDDGLLEKKYLGVLKGI